MKIINWKTKEVIIEDEKINSIKELVEKAVKNNVSLAYANLYNVNLSYANLINANFINANLENADLRYAYLENANLRYANLGYANLENANLRYANLGYANLENADLYNAYLYNTNLKNASLPHFQICPEEGSFYAWKKTTIGVIKVYISAKAKRTSSLVSRKCRTSCVKVVSGDGCGGKSPTYGNLTYNKNDIIYADSFDDDIRLDCTNGIHFFMTKREAEEW
jgi:hypothetical protein